MLRPAPNDWTLRLQSDDDDDDYDDGGGDDDYYNFTIQVVDTATVTTTVGADAGDASFKVDTRATVTTDNVIIAR